MAVVQRAVLPEQWVLEQRDAPVRLRGDREPADPVRPHREPAGRRPGRHVLRHRRGIENDDHAGIQGHRHRECEPEVGRRPVRERRRGPRVQPGQGVAQRRRVSAELKQPAVRSRAAGNGRERRWADREYREDAEQRHRFLHRLQGHHRRVDAVERDVERQPLQEQARPDRRHGDVLLPGEHHPGSEPRDQRDRIPDRVVLRAGGGWLLQGLGGGRSLLGRRRSSRSDQVRGPAYGPGQHQLSSRPRLCRPLSPGRPYHVRRPEDHRQSLPGLQRRLGPLGAARQLGRERDPVRDGRRQDLQRGEVLVRVPVLRYQRAERPVGQFRRPGRAVQRNYLPWKADESERPVSQSGRQRCLQPAVLELLGREWVVPAATQSPDRV